MSPASEIEQLRKSGDLPAAMAKLRLYSVKLGGMDASLAHQYAMILMAKKDWLDAIAALTVLAARLPQNAQLQFHLGQCLDSLGQYVEAKHAFRQSTLLHAKHDGQRDPARPHFALGNVLFRLGKDEEAVENWERGLTLPVTSADGRFQRSLVLLALGRYAEGWSEYEARKELIGYRQGLTARGLVSRPPAWDGQSKGRVMVVGTQGNGDVIQHTRYLRYVEQRSGLAPRLIAGPELAPWLGYQSDEPCDWSVDIDSLPHVLGMPEPFAWDSWLWTKPTNSRPTIGVCWKGSPHHANDHDRSSPISFLEAFVDPSWSVVSLQQGEGAYFPNYAATAEAIAKLDAVVTVDTSIAHVAGTLGVPTVVIPQCVRDYRWEISGDTSRWYPSVRLVRRKKWDAWPEAIEEAKRLLKEML